MIRVELRLGLNDPIEHNISRFDKGNLNIKLTYCRRKVLGYLHILWLIGFLLEVLFL